VAKVGTSNQDRTINRKAAVHSCINKQTNRGCMYSALIIKLYNIDTLVMKRTTF